MAKFSPQEDLTAIESDTNRITETASTVTYNETSSSEQTAIELTITARTIIGSIWIDMTNVTQNTTIKVYHKIDGTNYREIESYTFTPATDSDGIEIGGFTAYRDIKVTLTCSGGGSASVSVPYAVV